MKHNWGYKPFAEICITLTPTSKIGKSEYLSHGQYPIISQEDIYISGYWNDKKDITLHSSPVIIFGDHSRVLKYVDFEFVVGADGVKIIQPIGLLDAKFLYHFLRWYNVPSLGYSRHFKLLKEANYPVPPMETQKQIVAELDQINDLIAKNRELLSQLDALAQSLFYDTFGDPISNPKRWDVSKIQDLGKVITGSTPSTKIEEYYNSPDICFVKPGDIGDTITYISRTKDWITNLAFESCCRKLPIGTVVITCIGIIGKVGILKVEANCNQQINAIIPAKAINNLYLAFTLKEFAVIFTAAATGPVVKILNKSTFSNFSIPVPPLALQEDFASKVEAIEAQKSKVEAEIAELQTLLDARMDYWFN